jgi:tripartite-type tricarboxylate transporter receptor subunit TctC
MVHVPYKGTADAVKDLFEGRVMAYFDAAPTAISNEKTGKVRMLAVAAPERNKFMPQVPIFTELGLAGLDVTSWVAIVGPANIPADILAAVNKVFVQAIGSQAVTEAIARGAYETDPGPPQALAKDIRESYDRWGAMIKAMGMPKQ